VSLVPRRLRKSSSNRRARRRLLAVGAAGVVVSATAAGYAVLADGDPGETTIADRPSAAEAAKTTEIAKRDLVDTVEADGSLGYGTPRSLRGPGAGTVTALPEAGTVVRPNQPLYSIDGHAGPIVLNGELPMWRPLQDGVDDGADVHQLEANLVDLGFGDGVDDDEVTVDDEWTAATREAVEDWQAAHGLEETGRVAPTDVWFATGPVRVGSTTLTVGDPAAGEILKVTGTDRRVHVDLDTAYGQYAHEGDAVDLELADGTTGTGKITDVASTADVSGGQNDEPLTTTVAVEVTPRKPLEALDETPVTVSFTSDRIEGALAVPLEAVVATRSGGYALEVVDDDGTTHLVDVTLGRFADGWVQVEGDISEGQKVVTA
jgi:multidrug efflux pump subunit AcrA (membrane-fusion protein)